MVSESSDRERAGERDSRDCCEGERWEGDGEWEWGWEWRGDSGAWEGSSGSSERCEDALRDEGCRAGRLAMAALSGPLQENCALQHADGRSGENQTGGELLSTSWMPTSTKHECYT